jgi:Putative transposase DNA-binding domain
VCVCVARCIGLKPRAERRSSHVSAANRTTQARFLCVRCGYEYNADIVGASNILERGYRLLACQASGACNATGNRNPPRRSMQPSGVDAIGILSRELLRPGRSCSRPINCALPLSTLRSTSAIRQLADDLASFPAFVPTPPASVLERWFVGRAYSQRLYASRQRTLV